MCKWGTTKKVHVIRRNNSHVKDGWHEKHVDSCLANLIQEMNNHGILTLGCCCGHSKTKGSLIIDKEQCEIRDNDIIISLPKIPQRVD